MADEDVYLACTQLVLPGTLCLAISANCVWPTVGAPHDWVVREGLAVPTSESLWRFRRYINAINRRCLSQVFPNSPRLRSHGAPTAAPSNGIHNCAHLQCNL